MCASARAGATSRWWPAGSFCSVWLRLCCCSLCGAKRHAIKLKRNGAVAHRFSRKCSSHFQNQTYNQTIQKSMCIINLSKISDFRENLLHMLLFWVLILLDSYACSYKNRGCRMCNSPFLVSIITLPLRRSTLLQHITGQQKCKNKDGRKNIDRSMDYPAIQNASTGFF